MPRKSYCVLFFLILIILPVCSQENPFLSGPEKQQTPEKASAPEGEGPLLRTPRLFPQIAAVQRNLHKKITDLAFLIEEKKAFGVTLLLLGISFLYGFIHALGPGHRKIIITSYFLSEEIPPPRGIAMAFSVAMLHGLAALGIIGFLFFVLHATVSTHFNSAYLLIERISYGIIILLGMYLIIHALREHLGKKNGGPVSVRKGPVSKIVFVVSNGFVPCPGAAMILVFTFAYGMYGLGIAAVVAMSAGMGVLLALVAAVVLLGKERGLRRLLEGKRGGAALAVIEITGSILVLGFGLLLLLGSI